MALGENIKKKKLIPTKKSEIKEADVAVKQERNLPRKEELKQDLSEFLSKEQLERRRLLHAKFEKEIASLHGKKIHVIVFEVGGDHFAIEISKVDEVVVTPEIAHMPQVPDFIPGLATVRGKGVIVIDIAKKLGYPQEKDASYGYTLLVKTERFSVGILLREVPKNELITGDSIQTAFDNISATSLNETYVKGLIRQDNGIVFFLDIDEMIEGDRISARTRED